jgi:predicted DNA-binding ribbon-helix-helix protein
LRVTADLRIASATVVARCSGGVSEHWSTDDDCGPLWTAAEKAVPFPSVASILFLVQVVWRHQTEPEMKSLILKRSVVLRGHKTSISVEDAFWNSVKEIAASGQMSVSELISAIDSERHHGNLSSSIRLFVLKFYREQLFDRLDVRDKRKAIQRLISATGEMRS